MKKSIKYILILIGLIVLSGSIYSQSLGSKGVDLLKELLQVDLIDSSADRAIDQVLEVAWIVIVLVFGISFSWGYIVSGVKSLLGTPTAGYFDKEGLFYGLFIMILLTAYKPISNTISEGIDYVNSLTAITDQSRMRFENAMNKSRDVKIEAAIYAAKYSEEPALKEAAVRQLDKMGVNEDEYLSGNQTKADILDEAPWYEQILFYLNPKNWITAIFYSLGQLIVTIIRIVVFIFTLFYLKLLLVLGPLVFAFAVNPKWKDLISEWFGAILHAGLVFTTMNIIDFFYSSVFDMRLNNNSMVDVLGGSPESALTGAVMTEVVINISFIILYLSAFKLTKMFVPGKSLGSSLVGKTMAIGAAAVGAIAMGAGGVASGQSASNAFKNAASTAQKTASHFKDN